MPFQSSVASLSFSTASEGCEGNVFSLSQRGGVLWPGPDGEIPQGTYTPARKDEQGRGYLSVKVGAPSGNKPDLLEYLIRQSACN